MLEKEKNDNSREISAHAGDDPEDLDHFIEKRKIQNNALKKIVGLDIDANGSKQNETKDK